MKDLKTIFLKMIEKKDEIPTTYVGLVCRQLSQKQYHKKALKDYIWKLEIARHNDRDLVSDDFRFYHNIMEKVKIAETFKEHYRRRELLNALKEKSDPKFFLFMSYYDSDDIEDGYAKFKQIEEAYNLAMFKKEQEKECKKCVD